MSDEKLLDEIREAELKGASAEDKFAARLATASEQEFNQISRYYCNLGDQAKRRAKPVVRERSEEEKQLDAMDGAEYDAHLKSLGINSELAIFGEAWRRQQKENE